MYNMMNIRALIILSFVFISGCNPKASVDSVPDAKVLTKKFFKGFRSSEYEELLALYDKEFWKIISKETWLKILPNVKAEIGNIKKCELVSWNQRTQASTNGTGNFVTLQYSCEHEKYQSTMVFSILKPLTGGESTIIGHNMNSIGFLIE